jgi:hypothetical protein
MEGISHVGKFMASRERINEHQGTLRLVQTTRKTYTETKTKHFSVAGATGTYRGDTVVDAVCDIMLSKC